MRVASKLFSRWVWMPKEMAADTVPGAMANTAITVNAQAPALVPRRIPCRMTAEP